MTAAPSTEGPIGKLTAKAASAMAAVALRPTSRIATTAMPVGGQIGVT